MEILMRNRKKKKEKKKGRKERNNEQQKEMKIVVFARRLSKHAHKRNEPPITSARHPCPRVCPAAAAAAPAPAQATSRGCCCCACSVPLAGLGVFFLLVLQLQPLLLLMLSFEPYYCTSTILCHIDYLLLRWMFSHKRVFLKMKKKTHYNAVAVQAVGITNLQGIF